MLFKILHGDKARISTDITPYHEGYCYVTYDGDFYVDMNNERVKLNAKDAETIMGVSLNDAINNALTQAKSSGEFDGEKGVNGISATHIWNGTTLTITSASGTSSANLKGDKGDQGIQGPKGDSPIRGTDYWTDADKAEIKSYVDDAILNGAW